MLRCLAWHSLEILSRRMSTAPSCPAAPLLMSPVGKLTSHADFKIGFVELQMEDWRRYALNLAFK